VAAPPLTPNGPSQNGAGRQVGAFWTALLGVYFVGFAVLLGYALYTLWGTGLLDPATNKVDDVKFILMVIIAGALGSYVHAATSFADFVGNRRLAGSWVWWYILRPFIGIALALVLYFAIRGGLLPLGADVGANSLFSIAALSALAGMFSKQATDKLREVFDTFFRTAAGDQRADKLRGAPPKITAIDPKTVGPGAGETTIRVSGTDFTTNSVVRLDGGDRKTDFVSGTELVGHLTAADTQAVGPHDLTVFTPGGGSSGALQLVVG
jgi:IPT/TIG domain